MLFDLSDNKKPVKTIKDHHKNSPIVCVKFCDWYKEREVVGEVVK